MKQHNGESGTDWLLWVLMAGCVIITSVAFVWMRERMGSTLLAAVIWLASAVALCAMVW